MQHSVKIKHILQLIAIYIALVYLFIRKCHKVSYSEVCVRKDPKV